MSFTMEDLKRQVAKENFNKLSPQEQREVLQSLSPEVLRSLPPTVLQSMPLEQRLAGLSDQEIRDYLDRSKPRRSGTPRKTRRKK
jgi:hypothetical protein